MFFFILKKRQIFYRLCLIIYLIKMLWEETLYIILEYYLVENFAINFLLLYFTNRITKSNIKTNRILIGAIITTLYSLTVFSPYLYFLSSFIVKLLFSILIIYMIFRSKNIKNFLYQWLCFYILSFILAGAIISISSNFTNIQKILSREVNLFNIFSIKHILMGLLLAVIVSILVFEYNHRKKMLDSFLLDAVIHHRGEEVSLKALIDTGNSLKDPLTNMRVFVVEVEKLEAILPRELMEYYKSPQRTMEEVLIDLREEFPLTIIPFRSIGNEAGLILGFKPDRVELKAPDKGIELEIDDIIIGIYNGDLSTDGFSGLLDYESIVLKEEI